MGSVIRSDGSTRSLRECLAEYVRQHTLKLRTARQMGIAVKSLVQHAGDLSADQYDIDTLNRWLQAIEASCEPATLRSYRADVLAVLRLGADMGWCHEPIARRIRRPKLPPPMPIAWTQEQFERLLRVAKDLPGDWRGVPACAWFTCLFLMAYDTGFRRGNISILKQSNVSDAGVVYVRHEKTRVPHVADAKPLTVALFRRLPGDYPLACPKSGQYDRTLKRMCDLANIPHGGLQRIRKTAATLVWLDNEANPSRVQQFLGHLTGDMWRRYVDVSQSRQQRPGPPKLGFEM